MRTLFKKTKTNYPIALIKNSPLLSNLSARTGFSLVASLYKKPGPSADFEKVKGGRYLKEMLILNSFSFEDMYPRFTQAKTRSCTKVT